MPREVFDQIFDMLYITGKLAICLACRMFYEAKPAYLMQEIGKKEYDRFIMCQYWKRDQFFPGLIFSLCNAMHPLEIFDKLNQVKTPHCRICIKQIEHVSLHPSWDMKFL